MTRVDLLKRSKQEFEDRVKNALLWECDRVITDSGYMYIIKKSSRKISCAFHFAKSFEASEEVGKYENVDIALNTDEELGFDGVIEYYDLTVAFTSQGNYNETMKMWHYKGVGTFEPISNQFMITDEAEINNNLGVNSMELFIKLKENYPIVPSYFEAKSTKKYIMVDIENSEELGGSLRINNETGKYELHKSDQVKLTFVNFTRDEAMKELYRIQESTLMPTATFGLMSSPTLENKYLYQIAFNWKSLTYVSNFRINYYIHSTTQEELQKIKEAVIETLETL